MRWRIVSFGGGHEFFLFPICPQKPPWPNRRGHAGGGGRRQKRSGAAVGGGVQQSIRRVRESSKSAPHASPSSRASYLGQPCRAASGPPGAAPGRCRLDRVSCKRDPSRRRSADGASEGSLRRGRKGGYRSVACSASQVVSLSGGSPAPSCRGTVARRVEGRPSGGGGTSNSSPRLSRRLEVRNRRSTLNSGKTPHIAGLRPRRRAPQDPRAQVTDSRDRGRMPRSTAGHAAAVAFAAGKAGASQRLLGVDGRSPAGHFSRLVLLTPEPAVLAAVRPAAGCGRVG